MLMKPTRRCDHETLVPIFDTRLIPTQLRKFRAVPTVEMLRATWEKTTNPYVGI